MAEPGRPGATDRARAVWRTLDPDQRLAAGAAAGLTAALTLPWYDALLVGPRGGTLDRERLSALTTFTWVEGAILLVALAVLALLYARSQRAAFHLPGGDGTVLALAGGWCALLLVWRMFDTPEVAGGAAVGLSWGIFVALATAAVLAAAGVRARAAGRPEPGERDDFGWEASPPRRRRREPVGATADFLAQRPQWEGDVPEPPGRSDPPPAPPPPGGGDPPPPGRLF